VAPETGPQADRHIAGWKSPVCATSPQVRVSRRRLGVGAYEAEAREARVWQWR
jgi:hypothetical protein